MKKRYFVVLAMLVTFLFAEGEPAGSSGGGDTPTETVKTKEKTEKQKKEDKVYTVYYGDRFYGLQTKEIKL